MKRFMPVFFFLLAFAATSEAQMRWGVRVGITEGEPMAGGDVVMVLGGGFIFNPSVELSSEVFSANADFHYDIELSREAAFWVGAGAAAVVPDSSDVDIGVNLLAGIGVKRGQYIFYTQLKHTALASVDEATYNTLAFGVRF